MFNKFCMKKLLFSMVLGLVSLNTAFSREFNFSQDLSQDALDQSLQRVLNYDSCHDLKSGAEYKLRMKSPASGGGTITYFTYLQLSQGKLTLKESSSHGTLEYVLDPKTHRVSKAGRFSYSLETDLFNLNCLDRKSRPVCIKKLGMNQKQEGERKQESSPNYVELSFSDFFITARHEFSPREGDSVGQKMGEDLLTCAYFYALSYSNYLELLNRPVQ